MKKFQLAFIWQHDKYKTKWAKSHFAAQRNYPFHGCISFSASSILVRFPLIKATTKASL